MIRVEVDAGICGFVSIITAESQDMQKVRLVFKTSCPNLKPLEEQGPLEIDAYNDAFGPVGETESYGILRPHVRHAACPVPMAMVKAVEAAAGLALPRDVQISIRRQD